MKQIAASMMLMSAFIVDAQAQEASLSAKEVSLMPGEARVLEICADNSVAINGFQLTVTLPASLDFEAFETVTDGNGTPKHEFARLDAARKTASHSIMHGDAPKDKSLTFAAFSTNNATFKASEGAIMRIKVKAKAGAKAGSSEIKFSAIELSDANCQPITPADFVVAANILPEVCTQTLSVAEGWTWVSSHLAGEVPSSDMFANGATRVVSQTHESVKDPVYGEVGTVECLYPGAAYKIHSDAAFSKTYTGMLHNLDKSPIAVAKGWNWISYPYYECCDITKAITNAEDGDNIVAQNGFTINSGGEWIGSISNLVPGCGYLYKSVSDKTLQFDFTEAAAPANKNTRNQTAATHGTENKMIDIHKYPNTMNIIARLDIDDAEPDGSQYSIHAMSGQELRGVGTLVNGLFFITVYGDSPAKIDFIVKNIGNGETYSAGKSLTFVSDVVGSVKEPVAISAGKATAISDVDAGNCGSNSVYYNLSGQRIAAPAKGVYIMNGKKIVGK